jgi:GTP-binding protein
MAKTITPQKAEELFKGECVFAHGTGTPASLPREGAMPEIAFIGRSNVGKSSLINALTGQKMLARVSNTPGRTQQLNFFRLADRLFLVDMPGYGYAVAPSANVEVWSELIEHYMRERRTLKTVVLLIDSRHGFKANDISFMDMLAEYAVAFTVVLTKIDKIKAKDVKDLLASVEATLKTYPNCWPHPFPTSAEKGEGFTPLRLFLAKTVLE